MSNLNFPDPNTTTTYTEAGITWTWNATLGVWSSDDNDGFTETDGDTRYLRKDAAGGAQTVQTNSRTTFNGPLTTGHVTLPGGGGLTAAIQRQEVESMIQGLTPGVPGVGDITSVSAGDGLEGGGSIGAVSLSVDDTVVRTNANEQIDGTITFTQDINGNLNGNAKTATNSTNCSRSVSAGNGLTGGGQLNSNRTINVGEGDGIDVTANAVAVDNTVIRTTGNQTIVGDLSVQDELFVRRNSTQGISFTGNSSGNLITNTITSTNPKSLVFGARINGAYRSDDLVIGGTSGRIGINQDPDLNPDAQVQLAVNGDIKGTNIYDTVNVKWYGALGNGSKNDTKAIQAALASSAKGIYFPPGRYRIEADGEYGGSDNAGLLRSFEPDRKIWGDGAVITADTPVYKAFTIMGDNTEFSLHCDGNNNIGVFVNTGGGNPFIHDCVVKDLSVGQATNSKAIAFDINMKGLATPTGFTITNNVISNLYAKGDVNADWGDGGGLARAINWEARGDIVEPIIISNNSIDTVWGKEGDAISLWNPIGDLTDVDGHYFANVLISNNQIHNFNRRGIKIKLHGVRVVDNHFYNSWNKTKVDAFKASRTVQASLDLVDGGGHIVTGNIFSNCNGYHDIRIRSTDDPFNVQDFTISNNVFQRRKSWDDTTIVTIAPNKSKTDADLNTNLIFTNNIINCPEYRGIGFAFAAVKKSIISNNAVIVDENNGGTYYSFGSEITEPTSSSYSNSVVATDYPNFKNVF